MTCLCGRSVRQKHGPQGEPWYTEISDEECYFDEEYQAWLAGEIDDDGFAINENAYDW